MSSVNKDSFVSYSNLYTLYLILSSYWTIYDFQNDINKCGERGHVLIMMLGRMRPFSDQYI